MKTPKNMSIARSYVKLLREGAGLPKGVSYGIQYGKFGKYIQRVVGSDEALRESEAKGMKVVWN